MGYTSYEEDAESSLEFPQAARYYSTPTADTTPSTR